MGRATRAADYNRIHLRPMRAIEMPVCFGASKKPWQIGHLPGIIGATWEVGSSGRDFETA